MGGEPPNPPRIKADQYWPDSQGEKEMAQSVTFLGGIKVDHQSSSTNGSYVLRKFLLHLPGGGNREVTQMQCEIWPDLDAPDDPKVLVDMVLKAQELQTTPSPILVHCSAGVGRTGTFIALYKPWKDYKNPNVMSLAILPTVVELRQQRTSMVQRPKQYCYVAKCLSFLISMEEGDYYEGLLDGDDDPEEAEKIGENGNEETEKIADNNNKEAEKMADNNNKEAEKIGDNNNKETDKSGEEERKRDKEQAAEENVVETEVDKKVLENNETNKDKTDDEKRVNQKMHNNEETNNKDENMENKKEANTHEEEKKKSNQEKEIEKNNAKQEK